MMLQPGDILLYTASRFSLKSFISSGIRLVTGNKVTHVAIYVGLSIDYKPLLLDTLIDGTLLKEFNSQDDMFYRHKDGLTLYGVSRLVEGTYIKNMNTYMWCSAKYTITPYGFLTIFNILLQHLKGRIFKNYVWTSTLKSKNAYICSEVCQLVTEDVLRLNEIKLKFKKEACLTEPDDYLQEPWIFFEHYKS